MKLINRKHTDTKQKRANMQYITHIYPHPIIIENSYFLEIESFLPCLFRMRWISFIFNISTTANFCIQLFRSITRDIAGT